jgi:hypothetical protein
MAAAAVDLASPGMAMLREVKRAASWPPLSFLVRSLRLLLLGRFGKILAERNIMPRLENGKL